MKANIPNALLRVAYRFSSRNLVLGCTEVVRNSICSPTKAISSAGGERLPWAGGLPHQKSIDLVDCAKKREKLRMKWVAQTLCRNSDLSGFISAPITYFWVIHKNMVSLHIRGIEGMRTNIDIDDRLMRQAMRSSRSRTKRAAVEEGLRLLIQTRAQATIRRLRGKVHWNGDLHKSRLARLAE